MPKRELSRRACARIAVAFAAAPVSLFACLIAGRAHAGDPAAPSASGPIAPVTLDWRGPEDCQAAPRVLAEVRRLLGGERAGSTLVAHVKVDRLGKGTKRWHLTLTTERHGRGTARQIDAESCGAAADATAVILALTINPSSAGGEDEDALTSSPGATPVDAAAAPPKGAPPGAADVREPLVAEPAEVPPGAGDEGGDASEERGDSANRRLDFPLYLIGTVASDTGTLPHTGFGFRGGLGLSAGYFRVEAQMGYWPTVTAEVGTGGRGGSFTMLVADLRACVLGELGLLSLGPCAGGGITTMQAEGFGVTTPIAAGARWGSASADALLLLRLSRFVSPRLNAGVAIPFSRPTFEVQGLGPVHRPSAIALQIGVGMELHF